MSTGTKVLFWIKGGFKNSIAAVHEFSIHSNKYTVIFLVSVFLSVYFLTSSIITILLWIDWWYS